MSRTYPVHRSRHPLPNATGTLGRDNDREDIVEPTDATETATADPDTSDSADHEDESAEPLIEDELLVEEISIDGMCGVY